MRTEFAEVGHIGPPMERIEVVSEKRMKEVVEYLRQQGEGKTRVGTHLGAAVVEKHRHVHML
jgi:hypothetical protein